MIQITVLTDDGRMEMSITDELDYDTMRCYLKAILEFLTFDSYAVMDEIGFEKIEEPKTDN